MGLCLIIGIIMVTFGNYGLKRSQSNSFLNLVWLGGWGFVILAIIGLFYP